jgi:hypothetical protein
MPSGGKNTRRTRGGNASPDKTKEKTIATDTHTTLFHDLKPFDSREEGEGSKNAFEIETPGAPRAKRVAEARDTRQGPRRRTGCRGTKHIRDFTRYSK